MKVIVVCVIVAGAVIGIFCSGGLKNVKKEKMKQEYIGWEAAPKGMTEEERFKHNQDVLSNSGKKK